jgi:hypothetical protein
MERIRRVQEFRSRSTARPTREAAARPTRFFFESQPDSRFIAIPEVSSERRNYIPIGFLDSKVIVSNKIYVIESKDFFLFGVLSSAMHMAWVKIVSGRLESRFQYSGSMVYNTFPWPEPKIEQRKRVEERANRILELRVEFGDGRHGFLPAAKNRGVAPATLADLYDPLTMPPELHRAHAELDRAVEKCYRSQPFASDRERVEFLFALYEKITTPLALSAPTRKKRK